MVQYVRTRTQRPVWIGSANNHDTHRIESMYQARCANCDALWAWDQLTEKDGKWYCPNDYETNARELAERLAEDQKDGADKPVRYLTIQQPINAMTQSPAGVITSITDVNGAAVSAAAPLYLHTGGSAVTVKLGGQNFSSSDTISYTSGISDNSAPTVTATLITLSIKATGSAGDFYSLIFNGTTFRNIFRVR